MLENNKITLALETTIGGGSISILQGEDQPGFWIGTGKVSKASEFLEEIEKLFLRTGLKKEQIGLIVLSRGFGSFTGTRIGWALARGLNRALRSRVVGVPLLEALSFCAEEAGDFFICLPRGGREICLQQFERVSGRNVLPLEEPEILGFSDFEMFLQARAEKRFYLEKTLFEKILTGREDFFRGSRNLSEIPANHAFYIGLRGHQNIASDNQKPLYQVKQKLFRKKEKRGETR